MASEAVIDTQRLAEVAERGLSYGGHSNLEDGMCAMEAASYIAGEPWSDHPKCVSPVIAAFLRSWNDALSDADRSALITPDLIAATIATTGSKALEERRSLMAADWLVRTHAVAWLRLAKLDAQADALASLPEITCMAQVPSMRGPIEAARKDAAAARDAAWAAARAATWDAARDAAWAATWDAAWAAARAATWDAARDAARDAAWAAARAAARAATWDAARDAAWAATWDAARDAAWAALKPTRLVLQHSAGDLIRRMCALTDEIAA